MKSSIIKLMVKGGAIFIVYQCVVAIHQQRKVAKAAQIKNIQARYGQNMPLSAQKQKMLDQADQYLRNHAGFKYTNRARTQQYINDRLKSLIEEKRQQLKLAEQNKDQQYSEQLKKDIEQLDKAFLQSKPKYTSIKDFAQPDIQNDKEKYYERK